MQSVWPSSNSFIELAKRKREDKMDKLESENIECSHADNYLKGGFRRGKCQKCSHSRLHNVKNGCNNPDHAKFCETAGRKVYCF